MSKKAVAFGYRGGHRATLDELQMEVGPGWGELVEECFNTCVQHDVSVVQVKEKFGGLRFYVGSAPKSVYDVIDECERRSYTICEQCGESGKPRVGGWTKTLCDRHADGRDSLEDV